MPQTAKKARNKPFTPFCGRGYAGYPERAPCPPAPVFAPLFARCRSRSRGGSTSPKGAKLERALILPSFSPTRWIPSLSTSFRPARGEMPACRSISTKRRTSPKGVKYRQGRNTCLQEHFDETAHEPHRGEVSGARNPPAYLFLIMRHPEKGVSPTRDPLASLSLSRRSLHSTAFRVRDDVDGKHSLGMTWTISIRSG